MILPMGANLREFCCGLGFEGAGFRVMCLLKALSSCAIGTMKVGGTIFGP